MKSPFTGQSLFIFEQMVVDAEQAAVHAKLQAKLAAKAQRAVLKQHSR